MTNADTVTVPTGGNPARAVLEAMTSWSSSGHGVNHVSVAHDAGCPCVTDDRPLRHCTCEVVRLVFRKRDR